MFGHIRLLPFRPLSPLLRSRLSCSPFELPDSPLGASLGFHAQVRRFLGQKWFVNGFHWGPQWTSPTPIRDLLLHALCTLYLTFLLLLLCNYIFFLRCAFLFPPDSLSGLTLCTTCWNQPDKFGRTPERRGLIFCLLSELHLLSGGGLIQVKMARWFVSTEGPYKRPLQVPQGPCVVWERFRDP